jgi:hypothetical protein
LIGREELEWMRRTGWKREIEAVCETWVGGLVGYLTWKLRRALGLMDGGMGDDSRMEEDIMVLDGMEVNLDSESGDGDGGVLAVDDDGKTDIIVGETSVERDGFQKLEEDILAFEDDVKENQYFEDLKDDILDLDDMDLDDFDMDINVISDI